MSPFLFRISDFEPRSLPEVLDETPQARDRSYKKKTPMPIMSTESNTRSVHCSEIARWRPEA